MMLSQAIRELAEAATDDEVMRTAVRASVATLNEGVVQFTRRVEDPELAKKHRARLRAALHAMADRLEIEESAVVPVPVATVLRV